MKSVRKEQTPIIIQAATAEKLVESLEGLSNLQTATKNLKESLAILKRELECSLEETPDQRRANFHVVKS